MLIEDATGDDVLFDPAFARGAVPRDYDAQPVEMLAAPSEIPVIPRAEWDARIDEQERQESSLEHLWRRSGQMPLDQGRQGYCWAYSTGHALALTRVRQNQPAVRLSPHAAACKIKDFRDQGGWCGLSAQFARDTGYPTVDFWPEQSMDRRHDRPETWADAARHRTAADFVDLQRPVYSQNLMFEQIASCLLLNYPVMLDFAWWGHSVCGVQLVRVEPGSYGFRILNSWYDVPKIKPWGDAGFATIRGTRTQTMGAVCVAASTAS